MHTTGRTQQVTQGEASLCPGVTAARAHLPTHLSLRRLIWRRSCSPPDSVSPEAGRGPAGCLGNQLLGADLGEGRWFPFWGPGRARGLTAPVAAGWPLGPQRGQLSSPCGHVGSESPASASSCGFSTWWWPAPGRMQEESPPPYTGCSLHLALTSFPGAKTYQTFGLEGAVPPPPLPLLTGGRTAPPPAAALTGTGVSSGKCRGGDLPKCGGSFLLPGLQLCSGAPLSCWNTPLLPRVPWHLKVTEK